MINWHAAFGMEERAPINFAEQTRVQAAPTQVCKLAKELLPIPPMMVSTMIIEETCTAPATEANLGRSER